VNNQTDVKPKSNSNLILWSAIVIFILAALWLASSDSDGEARSIPTPFPTEDVNYEVLYRVTGNGRLADVTYENRSGNAEQVDDIEIPWQRGQRMEAGDFVYLSVQSGDNASRTITCQIEVNGRVVESATSSGRYVIASCSGSVGDD
jgi:hypothetical protein